jgi:hypothetical protein
MQRGMDLGMAAILTLVLGVTSATAQSDDCRAKCAQWGATCIAGCANAPVPDECNANCKKVQQKCLSDCAGSSMHEHDDFSTACERTT